MTRRMDAAAAAVMTVVAMTTPLPVILAHRRTAVASQRYLLGVLPLPAAAAAQKMCDLAGVAAQKARLLPYIHSSSWCCCRCRPVTPHLVGVLAASFRETAAEARQSSVAQERAARARLPSRRRSCGSSGLKAWETRNSCIVRFGYSSVQRHTPQESTSIRGRVNRFVDTLTATPSSFLPLPPPSSRQCSHAQATQPAWVATPGTHGLSDADMDMDQWTRAHLHLHRTWHHA